MVVGMPLSLSGGDGRAARAARAEAEALADVVGVPIDTYDERFTTVTVERALAAMDVRGPARRQVIDKVAAAVILQAYLDVVFCRSLVTRLAARTTEGRPDAGVEPVSSFGDGRPTAG